MRGDGDSHLIAIDNNRLGLDGAMSRAIRVRRSGIDIIPPVCRTKRRTLRHSNHDLAISTLPRPP